MRVICIDDKPSANSIPDGKDIKEGEVYEVSDSWYGVFSGKLMYGLAGYEYTIGTIGFYAIRFIPLSEIDETEMIRESIGDKVEVI